uniref:Uncharacterized protein n=1 Tax=Tetraselmis sp. GSL018 TaxID=582737 RepID=A0A061SC16_9CHLO|mmetsp:Transcript_24313/g.57950  ORF Transcript_24313/g.57950 Transcript_24313/m.57950 type:complete len:318 (-) Transcript_24313:59-1012(-)
MEVKEPKNFNDCIPRCILKSLAESKRDRVTISPPAPHRELPVKRVPVLGSVSVNEEYKFLSSNPWGKDQTSPAPQRYYFQGGPKRRQEERSSKPIRAVDGTRQGLLDKVAKSRASAESAQQLYAKDSAYRKALSLENLFDPARAESVDAKVRGRPRENMPRQAEEPARLPGQGQDGQFPADTIDMFLISKPALPRQRVVSDLKGDVGDGEGCAGPDRGGGAHPGANRAGRDENGFRAFPWGDPWQQALMDVAQAGESEAALDDRIGQFGGLIPTLYTMDRCRVYGQPVQKRIPPNRYWQNVAGRESRFTGAGFRRRL